MDAARRCVGTTWSPESKPKDPGMEEWFVTYRLGGSMGMD